MSEQRIMYERPSRLAPHDRQITWGLFGIALLVRAAYLKQLLDSPLWADLPVDLGYYHDWALRIAAGDWTGSQVFEQSPLYAYFLALVIKLLGSSLMAPRLIQILIGSATCVLVYKIGRQIFSPGAGLAAGLFAAFYGPFLFYDGMLMKEVFAVSFMTAMLHQIVLGNGSQRGLLATSGLCLGLGALVRDNLILVAPMAAVWLVADVWLRGMKAPGRAREAAGRVLAFGSGILLVVLPIAARNYHVSGEVVLLTSGGGEVFYIGNNEDADGRYSPPSFVRASSGVEHQDFRMEAARRLGHKVGPKESSGYWLRQGLGWIRSHPRDSLALLGRKLLIFWNAYELPDNHSYAHHRRLLSILRLPLLTFGWLAPLAAAGAVMSLARWRETLPLFVIGGGYLGSVMLFFNFGRFRMPLVPVLLIFAGFAVVEAARAASSRRHLVAGAGAFVVMMLVSRQDLEQDPIHLGQSHGQLAELLRRAGRLEEADAESLQSLRLLEGFFRAAGGRTGQDGHGVPPPGRPGRPDLGVNFYALLGESYATRAEIRMARGENAEAAAWQRHAADAGAPASGPRETDRGPVELIRFGEAELEAGRFESAAAMFGKALETLPPDADASSRLRISLHAAEALHRSGRPHDALAAVEKALAVAGDVSASDQADAHFGEALVYRDLGDADRMRQHLAECLRLNPSHPRAEWMKRLLSEP